MSNRLKIIITGSMGMLGKDMADAFSDYDLILYDKKELDLTDFKKVQNKLKNTKPGIIINCAAYTNVERAEDNQKLADLINGHAVGNLASICNDLNIVLLQISTEYVFDGKNEQGYKETNIPSSKNAYGKSKALGEKLLHKNHDKFYLIRTSWLYGHNLQKGKQRGINFVDKMLELSKEKDELNIVNDQFSKPTFTKDLAQAIKKLIEEKYPFGIYHLVNEDKTTPLGFAKEIFKIKNTNIKTNPISYKEYPSKVDRPINAVLLNTKFPKLRSWKKALREYLK